MKLYYAGMTDNLSASYLLTRPRPRRVLVSFAYMSKAAIKWMDRFDDVFVDSGAYTAWNKGKEIDIHKYGEFVLSSLDKYTIFASLDDIEDSDKSMENWKTLLKMGIPQEKLIPTVHEGEDLGLIDEYLRYTNYIALGGIAQMAFAGLRALDGWFRYIFSRHPTVKFHAFGISVISLLMKFPFYSSDAVTWRSGSRFGELITPYGRFRMGKSGLGVKDAHRRDILLWLQDNYGINPHEEDFHYSTLDKLNIRILYDLLEVQHKGMDQATSTQGILF